jgi:hypothetical protein
MGCSIHDDDSQLRKEAFETMVKDAGFDSIYQFSKEVGINMANIYSNLDGTWKMSIKRMFKIANTLGVPIGRIIEIFYPDEYEENMKLL